MEVMLFCLFIYLHLRKSTILFYLICIYVYICVCLFVYFGRMGNKAVRFIEKVELVPLSHASVKVMPPPILTVKTNTTLLSKK